MSEWYWEWGWEYSNETKKAGNKDAKFNVYILKVQFSNQA